MQTQEGRSGGGGGGLTGRAIQDGHGGWGGLALPPPLDGMEDPGREKREDGHRGGRARASPPGQAAQRVGVGGGGGAHGTQMGWGRGGTTELKTEPKKGRKNRN